MVGNIWEWTRSLKKTYPYNASDGREVGNACKDVVRVLRGGSWSSELRNARCATRLGLIYTHFNFVGLRVLLSRVSADFDF